MDHVKLSFTDEAVAEIAHEAFARKIGARGLKSIIEKALTETMYDIPSREEVGECEVTADVIRGTGAPEVKLRKDPVKKKRPESAI